MNFRHGHACMDGPLVCVIAGDDAAPEVVLPTVALLHKMIPSIRFREALSGQAAQEKYGDPFPKQTRQAIGAADCTFFGGSGGPSDPVLQHLRSVRTAVNIRPIRWRQGYRSPLSNPRRVNYLIVRDNLEGVYPPREGELSELSALTSSQSWSQQPGPGEQGAYAVRVYTDAQIRRVAETAIHFAYERQSIGYPGRVTVGTRSSIQPRTDGRFRQIVREMVEAKAGLTYQEFLTDDLARRMVDAPETLDVVVFNNEHGEILANMAAGSIGGLGLAPSVSYGEDYACFEPAHGSAPDLAGKNSINPTAMLLTGVLLLDYLGYFAESQRLDDAISSVYRQGQTLPVDQGGMASTSEFIAAVQKFAI
ncbi:MAG TPA: isocitrate/isopropylmalate family dehydrogenase [Ktedonobacteraceae bacterium]|nr:isocitrate/isopropylmalate family dehydrogenase [Ktedonobacteraceae bacterium]